jgi:hypothetical protein
VVKEQEPLAFLEKSHCVPILLALYNMGMLNRNQLYQELGETINIVIKRIELLKESGLVHEFKMKKKPFAKYLALTYKGREVAADLQHILNTVNRPGGKSVWRVNCPLEVDDQLGEDMARFAGEPEYERQATELRYEVAHLQCPECKEDTYLVKDDAGYHWICFTCGTKSEADLEDARKLLFIEKYIV